MSKQKSKKLSPEKFAQLCYLQLMQNLVSKHPSYIEEKRYVLEMGYGAFAALDIYNMKDIMRWHYDWNIDVDKSVKEVWQAEMDNFADLAAKGFVL